jgi:hypothetical protein
MSTNIDQKENLIPEGSASSSPVTRRALLGRLGASTAIAAAAMHSIPARANEESEENRETGTVRAEERRERAFRNRVWAARVEHAIDVPRQINNGDEDLYPNRIGNHSKGLPHDAIGEVVPGAYDKLLAALASGDPRDFAKIPLGGTVKIANPQGGLAFSLQGTDGAQLSIPPAPALASAERAGEMVEDYWMALAREVPFSRYGNEPLTSAAIDELNRLSDFKGPTAHGQVVPGTLFRGSAPGDLVGPYISQFLLQPVRFGGVPNVSSVGQKYNTYPAKDYLTTFASWLAVQNGQGPFGKNVPAGTSFIKNGRDLAAYDYVDYGGQAAVTALFWLQQHAAPLNPANPYLAITNQVGAASFGNQHIICLLYEVAMLASRAVFYHKWFVHRALRPEAYGGLIHNTLTGVASYPLHREVLNSGAVSRVFSKYGTYLLPHADPEGCPQHPAYPEQHSIVIGAQVTALKAFYDETVVLRDLPSGAPLIPSDDGQSLLPYAGSDARDMTVGGELNKLASNIALGRDIEAVHWRSDAWQGLLLGEQIAISVLQDQQRSFNEPFRGFTFTKFDGTPYAPLKDQ